MKIMDPIHQNENNRYKQTNKNLDQQIQSIAKLCGHPVNKNYSKKQRGE